ncbi:MAG TPA: class I SAM-dependent methyltransferase [Geobacterales bacterium]|nr:class I SAM-dependent methyltransferase [Geobacterales bacterium]
MYSSVIEKIEEEAEREGLPIVGRRKGKVLIDLIRRYKPKNILEIGTLIGYSAILMASNMKKGKLYTIELNELRAKKARENIERAMLNNKIEVLVGDAKQVIPKLNISFDMLFIDAEKSEYFTYLKLAEEKLKKGAIVVADNVKMAESRMIDYLTYVRNSKSYKSLTIDFGYDAMEISFKLF